MKIKSSYQYLIGIDPGTTTGCTVYSPSKKKILECEGLSVLDVMDLVKNYSQRELTKQSNVLMRIEDARKKKWFGSKDEVAARAQGAGSVKRDTKIWIEFCKKHKIDYEMVDPSDNITKLTADKFKAFTGYKGSTNEHGRDSAMLVFGY